MNEKLDPKDCERHRYQPHPTDASRTVCSHCGEEFVSIPWSGAGVAVDLANYLRASGLSISPVETLADGSQRFGVEPRAKVAP